MATAAGIPDHTAPTARSSSNLENCWDSCAWEQTENHTESPGSESGEFSADRSMEWVFKSSPWVDWDSMMVFPGRGREAERRLQTSDYSFPSSTLEASAAAEEHGVKQIADQTLTQGNSSTESRGMKGENNGETESSNSRGGLDHKLPSEAESGQDQRSLASVELPSCSLSSGYNHGVLWQNQKKDPGETQLKSTVKDHAQGFCLGFGEQMETDRKRGRDEEVQSKEVKAEVRNADALIGLKLGKRTYFEDSSGYAMGKVASAPPSAPPFPVKKQRLQSQASQIPRCQVQGCNLDLSTVKDYHRRHKVCEAHSKSLRVVVAGLEQRFCQQCSRFHILSEFDGVKRSCRRRLVGHNERRRKPPQPDTMAIAMARSLSSYQDHSVWSYANGPWPRLQNLEDRHGFADKLQIPASDRQLFHSALSVNSADRLLMPSQNSKKNVNSMSSNISSEGTNSFMKGKMEHTLSLSSSPGAEILAGLVATQASHNFTGLSDSGCALSLLSSEAWAPRSQSSVSFNFPGHAQGPFEQLMVESTSSLSQPQPFFSVSTQEAQKHDIPTKNLLPMQVQLQGNIGQIKHLPASIAYSIGKEAQKSSCMPSALGTVGHYGSQSMLCMLHEQDFKNSQQVGTMLNLMHAPPSSRWQSVQPSESEELQSISPRYPEIQSRRPFDSSIFDTEQM